MQGIEKIEKVFTSPALFSIVAVKKQNYPQGQISALETERHMLVTVMQRAKFRWSLLWLEVRQSFLFFIDWIKEIDAQNTGSSAVGLKNFTEAAENNENIKVSIENISAVLWGIFH